MRTAGLVGAHRRRPPRTTWRDRDAAPAPDLVQRQFETPAPNRLWVADITYVRTGAGWLYLAVVLDVFSRRVIGWAMNKRITLHDAGATSFTLALGSLKGAPPSGTNGVSD